ncbi:hypothetical protein ETB97_003697 [Aspergillus alliaceus]|uniref:Uncharacterized protein n=1 Tax=Petromyces alliaceus TaxID=209559 RepID=A0A8H6EAD1_PETAA|nr:hypothetical protein ETB97_003697 [Aspergillus burnettii]
MALETPHPVANDARGSERNIEAQGAFASNLARCGEILDAKDGDLRKPHTNGQGLSVHTPVNQAGSNVTYAANAHLMNQALMEMKMGLYHWFWFMMFVVIAPSVSNEAQFFFPGDKSSYLFISLHVSATAWPWMSNFWVADGSSSTQSSSWAWEGYINAFKPKQRILPLRIQQRLALRVVDIRLHHPVPSSMPHFLPLPRNAQIPTLQATRHRSSLSSEASFACLDSTIDATESRQQPHFRSLIFALRPADLPVLCLLWVITGIIFSLHKTSLSAYLAAAPNILSITPTTVTTNYLYGYYLSTALCAIPGPILAGILIQTKLLGRKHTGAVIAVLTSLFMLLATLAVQLGRVNHVHR